MPLALRLAGELLFPGFEAGGRAAALGGVGMGVRAGEHGQGGAESKGGAEHGKAFHRDIAANRQRLLARPPPGFEGCRPAIRHP